MYALFIVFNTDFVCKFMSERDKKIHTGEDWERETEITHAKDSGVNVSFYSPCESKLNSQRKREPFAFTSLTFSSDILNPCESHHHYIFWLLEENPGFPCSELTASLLGVKVFEHTGPLIYNQNTCNRHSLLSQHWFKIKWAIHRRGCMRNREMEIKATIKYNFYTDQIDKN